MKKRWLLLALAVVAVAAFVLTSNDPQVDSVRKSVGILSASEQKAASFDKAHGRDFATFTDPDYGFSIPYPVGYYTTTGSNESARFEAIAYLPDGRHEVIDVYVDDGWFNDGDVADFKKGLDNATFSLDSAEPINGRSARTLHYSMEAVFEGEQSYFRQAMVNCQSPEGKKYAATVVALVSDGLTEDLEMADYLISSFRC